MNDTHILAFLVRFEIDKATVVGGCCTTVHGTAEVLAPVSGMPLKYRYEA